MPCLVYRSILALQYRPIVDLDGHLGDEDFSKVTEVRFSLVDGTGGIDYKRRVNECFDAREMESRWNLCASQLSGCSLNAEELAISKLGLPRDLIVPALQKGDIIARAKT
ncbi:hypothetical protein F2Q68_00034316 [Brassica cretica]|uniref:Uncharacterized protein n=1 Tax=Brassica cretica TaxID=69181 RepID=A0A8S9H5P7_BRACR|nr:hypothetical protein F2Q68_00034316 [Brassica cretica]